MDVYMETVTALAVALVIMAGQETHVTLVNHVHTKIMSVQIMTPLALVIYTPFLTSYYTFTCAAICVSGCIYGECVGPGNCACQTGWTGDSCNTGNITH